MTKTETETIEYKKSLAELKEGLISIAVHIEPRIYPAVEIASRDEEQYGVASSFFIEMENVDTTPPKVLFLSI